MRKFTHVCYLDQKTTDQIQSLQKDLLELTGSKASLEIWQPHVTVGAEIWVGDDKLEKYYQDLEKISTEIEKLEISLNGFVFKENWHGGTLPEFSPYIIWLNVENFSGLENLANCIKPLTEKFNQVFKLSNPYLPHVTILFKDLPKEGWEKAQEYLANKNFVSKVIIDSFSIAEEDNDGKWTEIKRFGLI